MSLPTLLTPGTVIGGHYIINDPINSGGFGAVYRGTDTSEGNRACAIKEIYNVTPATRRQALMEASVLLTVRSPHLPDVYDALEANSRFYLIMELIEGKNLLQLLRSRVPGGRVGEQEPSQALQGPCSEQEVLSWLLPIMYILQELHSRHPPIMHRDIKPGNIILRPNQTAVLVDFGLTKLYDPARDTQTLLKAVSEGFSPAEQYIGKTTPQSDIYSMAATMYLLLTNRRSPMAVNRTVKDTLIPPRQLNPALSPHIEMALLRALSIHADQRFQSMGDFAQALRDPAFLRYAAPINDPYSDQTIAASVADAQQGGQGPILLPAPPPPPGNNGAPLKRNPVGASPPPPQVYQGAPSPPPNKAPGPLSYPYQPAPGYGMAPQIRTMPQGPLPSPATQGCLWGVVQGVLAGSLVAFTHDTVNFYIAILIGFGFYVLAGWVTTRRGGSSWRGLWSGFWAGIVSTIIFWVTYGIGYVILLSQRIQILDREMADASRNEIFYAAVDSIHTALPPQQPAPSSGSNVLILLVGGLVVASFLGLLGGILGTSSFKGRMVQKKQPHPHP